MDVNEIQRLKEIASLTDPEAIRAAMKTVNDVVGLAGYAIQQDNLVVLTTMLEDSRTHVAMNYLVRVCCGRGKMNSLLLLVEKGISIPSDALVSACSNGQEEVVRYLLTRPEVSIEHCLESACNKTHVGVIKLLLRDPRTEPLGRDLVALTNNTRIKVIQAYIDEGIISLETTCRASDGKQYVLYDTLLFSAVQRTTAKDCRFLLELGARPGEWLANSYRYKSMNLSTY